VDGDDADIVSVLRVLMNEADALAEVQRLQEHAEHRDVLYYYEATEVETGDR
jgi:hypothetical protein